MASRNNLGQFKANIGQTAAMSMSGILQQALAGLGRAASDGLIRSVEALAEPPSRARQRAMYDQLGRATQARVLERYDETVDSTPHASYRTRGKWPRYSKKLRPLLAGNIDGTIYRVVNGPNKSGGVRIELFNPKAMNLRAKHWARLEAGAGQGQGSTRRFKIGVRGGSGSLSLNLKARPKFRIPKGFWFSGGEGVNPSVPTAGDAFYVAGHTPVGWRTAAMQQSKITAGFTGRAFLEAGLALFADGVEPAFNQMLREELGARSRLRFTYRVDV